MAIGILFTRPAAVRHRLGRSLVAFGRFWTHARDPSALARLDGRILRDIGLEHGPFGRICRIGCDHPGRGNEPDEGHRSEPVPAWRFQPRTARPRMRRGMDADCSPASSTERGPDPGTGLTHSPESAQGQGKGL